MSYQTGTPSDVNDLLDKLRLFLVANGWTINGWLTAPGGTGKVLHVSKAGNFFTWFSDPIPSDAADPGPFVRVLIHTSYDAAKNGLPDQPGAAAYMARSNNMRGPMQAYHFFAGTGKDGPYVHVVVETEPGAFRHMGMGVLHKMGSYDGGQYGYGTAWYFGLPAYSYDPNSGYHSVPFDDGGFGPGSSYSSGTIVRADYGGISPRYHQMGGSDAVNMPRGRAGWRTAEGFDDNRGMIDAAYSGGASVLTGRAPLFPLPLAVNRGSALWSDIGYPTDVRFVRMAAIEAGEEYTIGTDTWVVFPVARKNGAVGQMNSGDQGFAYRKVA